VQSLNATKPHHWPPEITGTSAAERVPDSAMQAHPVPAGPSVFSRTISPADRAVIQRS
jgi:hypothetical protein